jgi:16S rRNA (cytosine1402-N4)-methyltransferase
VTWSTPYVYHTPVMADTVTAFLLERPGTFYIDATVGTGGHTEALCVAGGDRITVLGIDRDRSALEVARSRLAPFGNRVSLVCGNFRDVAELVDTEGCDGFMLDLGLSSFQLSDANRGFSYQQDGPLDMAMGKDARSVRDLLATASVEEIGRILAEYGEVKRNRAVARAVVGARERKRIERTRELRAVVERVIPQRGSMAALSRIFQAFRIWANGEMENLRGVLPDALDLLRPGGRLVVISYHSLEDRIVKRFFRREERGCICPPDFPECKCGRMPRLTVLTPKPVLPSAREVEGNPRARSARLRAAAKIV